MKLIKWSLFVFLLASVLMIGSCQPQQEKEVKAKYVFLFIGDGMGMAQVIAAEAFQSALDGGDYAQLNFREFADAGLSNTYASDRFITGSAASGTALATGNKTAIGRISMDTAGIVPFETLAEKAKKKGMRVGIISSVSLDHATPAVFYSHQPSRNMYFEIGHDLTQSDMDFFGGGGLKARYGVVDGDSVDLLVLAKENGFNYVNNNQEFRAMMPSDEKVLFINPELTGGESMYNAIDQTEGYVSLAEITQKAINYLDNENGFFMMVEGGKIDWLCHSNDAAAMVMEVLDFSSAVEEAIKFYKKHPDETLIVVTADHETGGLGLGNTTFKYASDYSLLKHQKISGENFNFVLSDWRKENHLNEKGFKKFLLLIEEYFGLGGENAPILLTEKEIKELRQVFMAYDISSENDYGSDSPLTMKCIEILTNHSGLAWTTTSHTGIDVPVYALGVKSELFIGNLDNAYISKFIWQTVE